MYNHNNILKSYQYFEIESSNDQNYYMLPQLMLFIQIYIIRLQIIQYKILFYNLNKYKYYMTHDKQKCYIFLNFTANIYFKSSYIQRIIFDQTHSTRGFYEKVIINQFILSFLHKALFQYQQIITVITIRLKKIPIIFSVK